MAGQDAVPRGAEDESRGPRPDPGAVPQESAVTEVSIVPQGSAVTQPGTVPPAGTVPQATSSPHGPANPPGPPSFVGPAGPPGPPSFVGPAGTSPGAPGPRPAGPANARRALPPGRPAILPPGTTSIPPLGGVRVRPRRGRVERSRLAGSGAALRRRPSRPVLPAAGRPARTPGGPPAAGPDRAVDHRWRRFGARRSAPRRRCRGRHQSDLGSDARRGEPGGRRRPGRPASSWPEPPGRGGRPPAPVVPAHRERHRLPAGRLRRRSPGAAETPGITAIFAGAVFLSPGESLSAAKSKAL